MRCEWCEAEPVIEVTADQRSRLSCLDHVDKVVRLVKLDTGAEDERVMLTAWRSSGAKP